MLQHDLAITNVAVGNARIYANKKVLLYCKFEHGVQRPANKCLNSFGFDD